jgi:hypothetical protein
MKKDKEKDKRSETKVIEMFECFQFSSNLRKCSKFKIILHLKTQLSNVD